MTDITAGSAVRWRGEIVALQFAVGLFLALRLYFQLNGDLLGDEAYYWMWGQHLGWSYLDHPPLHAWLIGAVDAVFGWHRFSVRLLTWPTLLGVLAIFWAWSKRIAPADPLLWFWRAAAVYLASPIFFGITAIAYHDHLLVFLALLAAHCLLVFVEKYESRAPAALRWLYLAAAVLGLAALTKYNAIFLGLGFALTFILRPGLRPLLLTPHPWLAGLLAIAVLAPVIWWNAVEGGASFRLHFVDRWAPDTITVNWNTFNYFALLTLLFWSPFLIWPAIRVILTRPTEGFHAAAKTLAVSTFLISTLAMIVMALVVVPLFYWSIVGFVALMPLLANTMGRWLRWSHIAYGLFWAGVAMCNYSVVPIGALIQRQDNGTSINYGWDIIAGRVRAAQQVMPADLVGGARYAVTSQLGFRLGTADVVNISPMLSQYDYWQASAPLAGKSAILLVDDIDSKLVMDHLQRHFTTLTQIDEFTIERAGVTIYRWRLFRGENYTPPSQPGVVP